MTNLVTTEISDRVLTITFNRPDKKNALNHEMYAAVADAMTAAETDDGVRAILITGAGDAFTAGNDLMDFAQNPPQGEDAPVSRFLRALVTARKPLIAAVNGVAVGVGLTMLLHCDIVYTSTAARISAPFVDLALVPEAGSSILLPQRVGHALAAEVFMLGRVLTGGEAVDFGFASRVFAPEELMAAASKAALALARKAPQAVAETKQLMRGAARDGIAARMVEESTIFRARLSSPEVAEAIRAFMERRPPNFG